MKCVMDSKQPGGAPPGCLRPGDTRAQQGAAGGSRSEYGLSGAEEFLMNHYRTLPLCLS